MSARDIIAAVVSLFVLTNFMVGWWIGYSLHNEGMLQLSNGGALSMATAVVGYWVGSSHSSQKKDETIAAQAATLQKGPTT